MTYTDDRGQRIERPVRPTRIVPYDDAAAALVEFGVRPVGMWHFVEPADDPAFSGVDLSGIEVVGRAYGEISIEALAPPRPDLVVPSLAPRPRPTTSTASPTPPS